MTVLKIDTSSSDQIVIGLDDKEFSTDSRKKKSQQLLPFIHKTLKKNDLKLKDIKNIEIETGPGSFTGLRVGLSVANAISWALKVPVNGKKVWKGEKVELKYD